MPLLPIPMISILLVLLLAHITIHMKLFDGTINWPISIFFLWKEFKLKHCLLCPSYQTLCIYHFMKVVLWANITRFFFTRFTWNPIKFHPWSCAFWYLWTHANFLSQGCQIFYFLHWWLFLIHLCLSFKTKIWGLCYVSSIQGSRGKTKWLRHQNVMH